MKAKDITPGDYEVKHWSGGRKANIVRVGKMTVSVMPAGSYQSYNTQAWRAVELAENGSEVLHPLGHVMRPWADAEPEHTAREESVEEGKRVRADLAAVLELLGFADSSISGSPGNRVELKMSRADAIRLADRLRQVPAE